MALYSNLTLHHFYQHLASTTRTLVVLSHKTILMRQLYVDYVVGGTCYVGDTFCNALL